MGCYNSQKVGWNIPSETHKFEAIYGGFNHIWNYL